MEIFALLAFMDLLYSLKGGSVFSHADVTPEGSKRRKHRKCQRNRFMYKMFFSSLGYTHVILRRQNNIEFFTCLNASPGGSTGY